MIKIKKIQVLVAIALLLVIAGSAVAMAKQEEIEQKKITPFSPEQKKITDTFNLKQGYNLHAVVNVNVNKTWIELIRANGDLVDDNVFDHGEYFSLYDDETLIVEATKLILFNGTKSNLVVAHDFVQYNKNTGNPILTMDRLIFVCPDYS